MLSWEAKRFLLLVILFSTCILPLLSVAMLSLNPKFDMAMPQSRDRIIPLLSSGISYYLGSILLGRVNIFPVFKLFLLASVLVIIAMLFISYKWKISNHMAAIGGLGGTIFALSFRSGLNPVYPILIVILLSGLVGSARLFLEKHNIWQIIAGYVLGFTILYSAVYLN